MDENHTHHARAAEYWKNEAQERIAFCRTAIRPNKQAISS